MELDLLTILGLAAGTLATAAFVPQVFKTWTTRSTKDISLGMFTLFCTGVFLWLMYGVFKNDFPIIVANAVTFTLALVILIFKLKYK